MGNGKCQLHHIIEQNIKGLEYDLHEGIKIIYAIYVVPTVKLIQ